MGSGLTGLIAEKCQFKETASFSFEGNMTLSELKSGEQGMIKGFESGELELKLMEMGCIPGETVVVEQVAPLGDPICVRVSGYVLSLRRNEAAQILLED